MTDAVAVDPAVQSTNPTEEPPRKRKRRGFADPDSNAAAATSSASAILPTPDVPGASVASTTSTLNGVLQEKLRAAKEFALRATTEFSAIRTQQMQVVMMAQQNVAAKQRAHGLASRVYVGSLFYATTKETVGQIFRPFGVIRNVDMPWDANTGAHKGFAFVEFDNPEAAQMSINQMNGFTQDGRAIKCGRPNTWAQAQPLIESMAADDSNKTRVYVSSIHADLSEDDVLKVFEAFGPVVSCKLCPDPLNSGKHLEYGYITYENETSANEAVAAMHNFELGGQYFRVCKAITTPEIQPFGHEPVVKPSTAAAAKAASAAKAAAAKAGITTAPSEPIKSKEGDVPVEAKKDEEEEEEKAISGAQERFMMMQKLAEKRKASTVLVLRNMVEEDEEGLDEEVSVECQKFGAVEKVVIFEEKGEEPSKVDVKIFVKFVEPESAKKCLDVMDKRLFGGRVVVAELYDESMFATKDYSA